MEKKLNMMLQAGDYAGIASFVSETDTECAREVLSALSQDDLRKVCNYIDADTLSLLLPLLDVDSQKTIVSGLREGKLDEVMDNVSVDDTMEIIDNLPASVASKVVEVDEIANLLCAKRYKSLKELLLNMNPVDIASALEILPIDERMIAYRLLSKDVAAEVFVEFDSDEQRELLDKLSDKELSQVMDELFIDDAVDLIEEMPASVVKRLLAHSDKDTRKYINEILKYPQNSTGSIMTVEMVSLAPDITIGEAFDKIRKIAIDKETIYTCYVIDATRHLIGVTSVKEMLLADRDCKIESIMHESVICAHTLDNQETTARRLSDYGFLAMPVVDDENRLVGIVTIDDALQVIEREDTEDISKIAATKPSSKPYLKTSVFTIFKSRLPWLLILMVSATFTGLIINKFEGRLNAISTVLIACVPMLMDTGGNAGSQSSVTVIRALALGEVGTKDVFKVLAKELCASLMLGLCLAIACFAKLQLIDNLLFGYSDYTLMRSAIVSVSLLLTVIMAKTIGCLLPLGAKAVKLDPAVVASPFITTIVDALSLMVFCGLSVGILS